MHELVYVLTVESLVFGLLGVLLVAQRWNITQWPDDRAWPVFSTCLVLIFAYSLFQIVLCCVIAIGRFGALTHSLMDACARSAGRLVTSAVLSVCYVSALLFISYQQHSRQCLIMQLYGSNCAPDSVVLWSFSIFAASAQHVYFAVLVPLWALVAALLLTAAGMCKDEKRASRGRLLCINTTYLLAYHVNYMLRMNIRCQQACSGEVVTKPAEIIICKEVLFFAGALCVSDILAETVLVRHTVVFRYPTRGRDQGPNVEKYMMMRISGVFIFCILRIAQVLSVVMFNWFAESSFQLPWQLMVGHVSLASVCCLLDIVQVVIEYAHTQKPFTTLAEQNIATQQTSIKPDANMEEVVPIPRNHKPFEVDTKSRKKFMMTFTGRSRWPAMLDLPTTNVDKKKT